MAHCVAGSSKIIGVVTLGVLTGAHLDFTFNTLKSILSLPSSTQALPLFTLSTTTHRRLQLPLELLTSTSLLLAYFLAPPRAQHPYLLMCAATPLLGVTIDRTFLRGIESEVKQAGAEANGEIVRGKVEGFWKAQGVRSGIAAVGFLMGVVGIWGDGF